MTFAVEEPALGPLVGSAQNQSPRSQNCALLALNEFATAALSLYWNFLKSQKQANSDISEGNIPKTGISPRVWWKSGHLWPRKSVLILLRALARRTSHSPCSDITDPTTSRIYHFARMTFDRTFFVTTVTWQRTPLFRNPQKAELMMDVLAHYREQGKYVLHEFVIMPDHLHLLLTPTTDIPLERAVQFIKGGFSYRLGKAHAANAKRGLVWQESFTSHRIRDERDYEHHAAYIRMNPVRAHLAKSPELYPYSSATCGRAAIYGRVEAS